MVIKYLELHFSQALREFGEELQPREQTNVTQTNVCTLQGMLGDVLYPQSYLIALEFLSVLSTFSK